MSIPGSLTDAIAEEPDRFIKYLKLDKIALAKNPYREFLRQFERRFGKTQGIYLWNYLLNNYDLTNKFYNLPGLQNKLPENFKGNIDKQEVQRFFDKYNEKIKKAQDRIDKKRRQIKVKSYKRDGKRIKSYNRSKKFIYTGIQNNFILSGKSLSNKELANRFNKLFSTKLTTYALRDKKLRLLGRK